MVGIPLEGKSPLETCLEILEGKYSVIMEKRGHDGVLEHDDRELQMAACFFIGKQTLSQDLHTRVTDTLVRKLQDIRAMREYNTDHGEESYWGTDYFISACAAEVLVMLGYAPSVKGAYQRAKRECCFPGDAIEFENNREGYRHPREIVVKENCLRLEEMQNG